MPYLHKAKWGALESLAKRTFTIDPHMYSAAVGTIRADDPTASGFPPAVFWRTKTRCSTYAEWMELHDASDGAVLWRAEARYSDRATPVATIDPGTGREYTEFLTTVRLYLESEAKPRLMLIHRDRKPAGLRGSGVSRTIAVYTLDPAASHPDAAVGLASEDAIDKFEFAELAAGEDIFQLTVNPSMTSLSLAAVRLPDDGKLQPNLKGGCFLLWSRCVPMLLPFPAFSILC